MKCADEGAINFVFCLTINGCSRREINESDFSFFLLLLFISRSFASGTQNRQNRNVVILFFLI